jgi:hypothetical protein
VQYPVARWQGAKIKDKCLSSKALAQTDHRNDAKKILNLSRAVTVVLALARQCAIVCKEWRPAAKVTLAAKFCIPFSP